MATSPRPLRIEPLWARVDGNRTKLTLFVALFTLGSALLLDLALVGVPGSLIGWAGSGVGAFEAAWYWPRYAAALGIAFGVLLAGGTLVVAVQLANAEDWVTNRFKGHAPLAGQAEDFVSAVDDIAIASGLPEPPRVIVLDEGGINAFAVGTSRNRPLIGVSAQLLETLSAEEQRAVIATLVARICAGDILFGTALAALMGPLKAIRESRADAGAAAGAIGDGCASDPGCADGCGRGGCDGAGCLLDGLGDSDNASGCLVGIAFVVFMVVVAVLTYLAVVTAAWVVTLWGRALHRTGYEKADAEGMLLLKDPAPMLSALRSAIQASNLVGDGDSSYDGIFYTATSGKPGVDAREKRRYDRLREVLGTDGLVAEDLQVNTTKPGPDEPR